MGGEILILVVRIPAKNYKSKQTMINIIIPLSSRGLSGLTTQPQDTTIPCYVLTQPQTDWV